MADRYPLLMRRVQDRQAQDRFQEAAYRYDGFVVADDTDSGGAFGNLTRGQGDMIYVSKTDLNELVQDILARTLVAGDHISTLYNDAEGTLTLYAQVPPNATDPEAVRDIIGAALIPGTGVTVNVNDASDTITLGVDVGVLTSDPSLNTVKVNYQTGSTYVLALSDAASVVEMNNNGINTVTVPASSGANFPIGTLIEIDQIGSGQTSVVADTGVTLRAPAGAKIAAQYGAATLRKRATDEWIVSGLVTT